MDKIDENLISKLEKLSKLVLDQEEKVQISKDLVDIVQMFDKLQEVNTVGILPTSHITTHEHPLRQDEVGDELTVSEALHNSPSVVDTFIAVPKFLKPL